MPLLARHRSELYYEVHGEGPAVLFAHGVGGNHASWYHQIAALAPTYRVIVFDARGFGNSTDAEALGRSGFVDDLHALLDHLQVERAVLVGQSMGGGTCLSFTCRFPRRVSGLVLADTLMGVVLPAPIRDFMADLTTRAASWSQAERVLGPTFRAQHPALALLYTQLASFNAVNVRTLSGAQSEHTPQDLASTGVPVLYVVGEEDALFPPRAVRAVHSLVHGSRLVEIKRSGHSAYFEQPAVFNQVLCDWMSELPWTR